MDEALSGAAFPVKSCVNPTPMLTQHLMDKYALNNRMSGQKGVKVLLNTLSWVPILAFHVMGY